MTAKSSKRLERMRSNLQNWSIEDIAALCREHGVRCDPPRGGGSHYKISHPDLVQKLTIPARRPIKPVYIRELVDLIDALRTLP